MPDQQWSWLPERSAIEDGSILSLQSWRRVSRCTRTTGADGDSGDSRAFSIDAEVEDLRAVVAATGETPLVYGLSSGAALALEAAAQAVPMRKLAVYEAPYMDDDQRDVTARSDLERLIAAGDREGCDPFSGPDRRVFGDGRRDQAEYRLA
ncbi:hypothetical protein GCM10020255_111240 [Rhodococcus baikonurensis]